MSEASEEHIPHGRVRSINELLDLLPRVNFFGWFPHLLDFALSELHEDPVPDLEFDYLAGALPEVVKSRYAGKRHYKHQNEHVEAKERIG